MKLAASLAEVGFVEFAPKQEGRNMSMVLGPVVKKNAAVAQQRAAKKSATPVAEKEEVEEVKEVVEQE